MDDWPRQKAAEKHAGAGETAANIVERAITANGRRWYAATVCVGNQLKAEKIDLFDGEMASVLDALDGSSAAAVDA